MHPKMQNACSVTQNCVYAFAAALKNAHASVENSGASLFFFSLMILYFLVLALHKVRVPAIIFVSSECFSCCTLLISLWFAPSAVHKSFA